MDEINNATAAKKSPIKTLIDIDGVLASAYQAPRGISFSKDPDTALIQKAVMYHRMREDSVLRTGDKTVGNDLRYEKYARDITDGRDPLIGYLQHKSVKKQAALLDELTKADTQRPWFEKMVQKAADKKAEAAEAASGQNARPTTESRMAAQKAALQGKLFGNMAEDNDISPRQFLSDPENAAAMKRLLAIEFHSSQKEYALSELKDAYRFDSPEQQERLIKNRQPFSFEQAANNNYEAYMKSLEDSTEVNTLFQRLAGSASMQDLSRSIADLPRPQAQRKHESLELAQEKQIPAAINAVYISNHAPKTDSKLDQLLKSMLPGRGLGLSFPPTEEGAIKVLQGYSRTLEELNRSELVNTAEGKVLKQTLENQRERVRDIALAPEREKIKLNYRADTLIDYVDTDDPNKKPMDGIEAREKLIRGAELEQKTFVGDDFMGTVQKVSYDKKTGLVNKGPEKLITRVVDLSKKTEKEPMMQLEELRKIKDILDKSNTFYAKDSEMYKKTVESLNKVIKTQQALDTDANVRQVAQLRALYSELDANVVSYLGEKNERMKPNNERAQFRSDAMQTLKSITSKDHVEKVTGSLYTEQSKLEKQQKMLEPCKNIVDKWKKMGEPKDPESRAQFKNDFNALSDRLGQLQSSNVQLDYFKMGIADGLDDFTKKADTVQKQTIGTSEALDGDKLQTMKKFNSESNEKLNELFAMDPTAPTAKKKTESIDKTIEPAQKVKGSLQK